MSIVQASRPSSEAIKPGDLKLVCDSMLQVPKYIESLFEIYKAINKSRLRYSLGIINVERQDRNLHQ